MMIIKLQNQIDILINGSKERREEYEEILKKNNGDEYLASSEYGKKLIINRDLTKELKLDKFENDFNNIDKKELKKDFEILSLTPINIKDIKYILDCAKKMKWTAKDLYNKYLNGCTSNILSVIICYNC